MDGTECGEVWPTNLLLVASCTMRVVVVHRRYSKRDKGWLWSLMVVIKGWLRQVVA